MGRGLLFACFAMSQNLGLPKVLRQLRCLASNMCESAVSLLVKSKR